MKENDKSPRMRASKVAFAMPSFQRATKKLSQFGTVLDPTSKFKRWWDLGLALCVLYNGIFCPLHVAFDLDISTAHQIIYRVVDLVFIADVVLNFNTGFYDKESLLVMDRTRIAHRYINSWFVVDVISSVPIEMMYDNDEMDKAGFMRLNKLLRLFKLAKMFTVIRLGRIHRVFNRWEVLPQLRYAVIDVLLHVVDGLQEHAWFKQAQENRVWTGKLVEEPYTEYILSLYHALMVMFTIDMNFRPENNRERVVTLTFGCFGAVLVLFSLSTVCIIIHESLSRQQKAFRQKIDHVNDFIRRKRIPETIATELLHFYEHLRNRDFFSLELGDSHMIGELPEGLKEDVLYSMHPRLMHGEFMRGTSRNLAVAVLNVLSSRHISPFEVLLEKGSPATEVYLIIHGEVEAWAFNGRGVDGVDEPVTLSGGDYVGQSALIGLERGNQISLSPVNAASLSFCDIFVLTRDAAVNLLKTLSPELKKEWLELCSRHADLVDRDIENGADEFEGKKKSLSKINSLARKMEELMEKEKEIAALRGEVLALMSSRASFGDEA